MPEMSIHEIAAAIDGTVVSSPRDMKFSRFHFDSRMIDQPGTLFFALKSDTSDGHRFVPGLASKEQTGAVVSKDFDASGVNIPLIRAADPMKAAQALAAHVRQTHRGMKYVGVTGSAGKTTTKEFIYQVLGGKYRAGRSYRNYNNWIGMPFSLLNLSGKEEAAVFELAMSYPGIGEIDLLASILRPDAAVVINALPVHLEYLKTVENVAKAKCEILNFLAADDIAFINGDCQPLVERVTSDGAPKGRKIFFGRQAPINDIRLIDIRREQRGGIDKTLIIAEFFGIEQTFETPLVNRVHVENLFTAIVVAMHLGMKHVEIQEALETIQPLNDRGDIRKIGDITIIDETYNSNPEALKKTLEWVDKDAEYLGKGEKIAVVGDMLELGDNEVQYHKEVGKYFAGLSFDRLVTVGKLARHIADGAREAGFIEESVKSFDDSGEAGVYLKKTCGKDSVILFKASRGIRMEHALKELSDDRK